MRALNQKWSSAANITTVHTVSARVRQGPRSLSLLFFNEHLKSSQSVLRSYLHLCPWYIPVLNEEQQVKAVSLMMWQSEGISRPRCTDAFSSVTDEQSSRSVSPQSANKVPCTPSPPTPHYRQGGWSHRLWLTAFASHIPAHLNAPQPPTPPPSPCMVYH